ncbi:MAG: biotin transporter BioY [Clostridia bacterium]|nr:biotin transporter BioY [Clostridia bacterium]
MNKRINIKKICITAVFTAIIAALSQIAIPTPVVYITLQTLGIAIAAFLLSPLRAAAATVCYILLGATGVPVFAGFSAGVSVLLGPTGGFLFGFPIFAVGLSLVVYVNRPVGKITLCAASLLLLYILGVLQYIIVTGNSAKAAILAFALYFIKDTAVLFAAYFLCVRIRRTLSGFIHPK